jgi:hypothetical protein
VTLRGLQLQRLQALRAALRAGNAFYGPRMEAEFATLEEFSERVPFTVKLDFVADPSGASAVWDKPHGAAGELHAILPDEQHDGASAAVAGYAGELGLDAGLLGAGLYRSGCADG